MNSNRLSYNTLLLSAVFSAACDPSMLVAAGRLRERLAPASSVPMCAVAASHVASSPQLGNRVRSGNVRIRAMRALRRLWPGSTGSQHVQSTANTRTLGLHNQKIRSAGPICATLQPVANSKEDQDVR